MFKFSRFCRIYCVLVVLLLFFVCGLFLIRLPSNLEPDPIEIAKKCFFHDGRNPNATGKSITFFEDLLTSKLPEFDQGIFFLETECSSNGIAHLKPRYACSIESAAKANPTRDVYMIYASPVGLPRHEQNWSTTIKALKEYPNVHFRNVQLKQLCASTPLEKWIETSELFKSIARYEHASDIIRALLVYKYGGTYMDLDFMMLKSLDTIPRNWIARQINDELNGAVFDFLHSGIGNIVLNEVLSDLAENYRPGSWAYNGPYSFQRVMESLCDTEDLRKMDREQCRGVEIYSPRRFYPIYGRESLKFFDPNARDEVFGRIKDIMGFHFWNSHSKDERITMGNGAAYESIAEKHCPRIYAEHDEF